MQNDGRDQNWTQRLALPASLAAHLAIAALLIFGLPQSSQQPQEDEQAVKVDVVPPPKSPEKPKTPPPAPKPSPEKPKQENVQPPPPAEKKDAARQTTLPAQKPVFQFGEKDGGPRKSSEGNSAEDGSTSAVEKQYPDKQEPAKPQALTAAEGQTKASRPEAPATPKPKPAEAANARKGQTLKQAKTLFSRSATDDPIATTAMGNMARSVRGGRLCETELREQLPRASPPYFPRVVPSYRLTSGTVINVSKGALLLDGGQWRNLSFRCEVDADAMKVVSFAFRVGDPIPRGEWERRGLPSQ